MVIQFLVQSFRKVVAIAAIAILATSCSGVFLSSVESNPWKVIDLASDVTLSDIAFTSDRNHGWLVGNHNALLETIDGGETWKSQPLDLEQNYTFTSVSFVDDEGWVVGQPSLLLHTQDSWAVMGADTLEC